MQRLVEQMWAGPSFLGMLLKILKYNTYQANRVKEAFDGHISDKHHIVSKLVIPGLLPA